MSPGKQKVTDRIKHTRVCFQMCLYLSIKSGEISRERTAYMAALMIYQINGAFGPVLQTLQTQKRSEGEAEEESPLPPATLRSEPILITAEECHRWDYLLHTSAGIDALLRVSERRGKGRSTGPWVFSLGGRVVVGHEAVCECPPFFCGLQAVMNSIVDPMRPEPRDRKLATAADAESFESGGRKLSRMLLMDTLEDRHLNITLPPEIWCRENPYAIDTGRAAQYLRELRQRCPREHQDVVIEVSVRYEKFLETLNA